ncbi:uncharacterized protein SCHCODRAFT_02449000, partial [Schizophyllum commune H4-8]|uniref:uncharacterized protein n=1 Tax=Schizophyllum commune (strain H4-8 / FGSC 9210) TaxID=578458 RepID=UPI00215E5EBF
YAPAFARPPALLSHLSTDMKASFREAYLKEPYWRRRYEEADTVTAGWTPGRRYYRSEDDLLFFLDADYLPRLCVPDKLVGDILISAHEEPMEGGHTG